MIVLYNEEIKNILFDYDLTLIEFKNTRNIFVKDNYGYKYKVNLCNIKKSHKLPHLFRGNPFAIHNIKNYLKLNNIGLILISTEYFDCKQKLAFICEKHKDKGIQYKTLDGIINDSQYCKFCSAEARGEKYRILDESIINRCNELDLIYIDRYIKDKETWIKFKCKKHLNKGIQEVSWYHLSTCSVGCAYCTGRYKTTNDFIMEMKNINPDIEIIGEYIGSEKPVLCKCKKCSHIWSPIGRSLKNRQGCPSCASSKGEQKIKRILESNNIMYISQKTFDDCIYKERLRFDFYLPICNTIIEYDGEQHFMPVDFANKGLQWAENQFKHNQLKDKIKNDYCNAKNIRLIRIPYYEFNNIEAILTSELPDVFLIKSL